MNSRGILIFFAIPILTVTTLLFLSNAAFLGGVEQSRINDIKKQQDAGTNQSSQSAALPNDTDAIGMFFQALQEKNTTLSLGILDSSNIPNQEAQKQWEAQFNSFSKAELVGITPENQTAWTQNEHRYKVTVNVTMQPEAAKATVPNYGWQNGDNIRWITMKKGEDGLWRILEIATGP